MTVTDQTHIRMAGIHDLDRLAHIIRSSHRDVAQRFHLTVENCPKHPSNCTNEWIGEDLDRGVAYYILERSGNAAGCIALERASSDICYIERLSVLPENRRRGYGRMLVGHVFETAGALGAREIGIGIIEAYTELKAWYRKIGFIEGEIKEFGHLPFRVLLLTCQLSDYFTSGERQG